MKRIIYIGLACCLLIIFVYLCSSPAVTFLAKKQLTSVFPGSKVSIGKSIFSPLSRISLFDLEVKKDPVYDFKVGELGIYYTPASLFKRTILKVALNQAGATIDLGQKSIAEFKPYLNLRSPGIFLIRDLELSGLGCRLKSKELNLTAVISAGIDPLSQALNYIDLDIDKLDGYGLLVENAALTANKADNQGGLSIALIQYNKAKIKDIKSSVKLSGKKLDFTGLSAELLSGKIEGLSSLNAEQALEYYADLKFSDLDMEAFVRDFNLGEKFQLTGKLNGSVELKGRGESIKILSGNFSAAGSGGVLSIKDDKFLKNLAQGSGQSLDIIVESFKNYHYNTGLMKLSLDKNNLIFDVALDGEAGKRNLNITVHDFQLGRGN